jgi:2'-5' RNA ligase
MSFIGIRIPTETARLIHEIDVPGEKEDTAHLHITLLDLGEEVPIEKVARAIVATYSITQCTSPFWVKIGCVSCFPARDPNVPNPIIAPIINPTLQKLHCSLKRGMGKEKVDYVKRFKEYRPHITLAYNEGEIKRTKIEPIEFSVQEIVLWGGSDGDNRMFATFPLEIRKNEEIECLKKSG